MYAQSNQIITHPPKNNRINTNVLSIFISRCAVLTCLVTQSCPPVCDPMDCSLPGPSVHGDPPGKNTGVGCHVLLQGTFLTQGSNLCPLHLLHWQAGTSPLAPPGKQWCCENSWLGIKVRNPRTHLSSVSLLSLCTKEEASISVRNCWVLEPKRLHLRTQVHKH